jgi:2-polyprenyl-6-methoxyphenol hydroxylase-like FAD-dependent oxidoreductase
MHHHPSRYDVIVVGARAAGAATGMLLARAGLDVLIVDRSRHGADTLSTHALMRAAVLQLHRWGLLDRIVDAGTPPIRRTVFRYADGEIALPVKPAHGIDALYAPRRTVLDATLVDAARRAGAAVRFDTSVSDLTRDPDGRVTGISGRTRDGQTFQASAGLVIGADGRRSVVAERVGAPFERIAATATATTYAYWSDLETDGYEFNFRRDAASGVIPTNDGAACVFACAPPAAIGRGGIDVIARMAAAASPDLAARLAAARPLAGVRTFAGQPGHVRTSSGAGWALVGDAGYWKDPATAHGLTDALRDAELLSRAVVDAVDAVVAGSDEHPERMRDSLAAYQAQRDELSSELFTVTEEIAGHQWTDDEIPGLLLRLSASMNDEIELLAALRPALHVDRLADAG